MTLSFLPNEADATYSDQAEPDSVDFETLLLGHAYTGVVSGCAVTESGTPAQTVDVASGNVVIAGKSIAVSGATGEAITAANATNPRIDLISVNSSGSVVVTDGTAAAQPVAPAIPATSVPLAFLYVPANDNTHTDNQINDKRVIVPAPRVFDVQAYGATGDGSTNDTTAIQAAIDAAEVSGGVVLFPTADYATNALTLTGNEKVILDGQGSTIRAFSGTQTLLTINRTYGGTAISCVVKDFLFHNNSQTSVTAIEVQDTHRAYLRNLDFNNTFATAIYLHNNDASAHTEGTLIENVFITGSDTGIKFVKETVASDSFNQTQLINVGITDCDTGIDIGATTNLARCTFVNVTVWAYRDNSTCVDWDGYTDMVFWDLHLEAISSTGTTGLNLGSNLSYFSDNNNHHINLTFIGTFADEVSNSSSKPLRYTDGPNVVYTGSITPWGIKDEGEGSPSLIWDIGLNQFKRGDGSAWPAKIFPLEAREVATSPTLDWSYGIVNVETTAAGRSVTLPDNATYSGKSYLIRRDGANGVTINRAGSDTFDDAATSKSLDTDGAAIGIFSIGDGEWKIVGTQGTVT